MGSANATAVAQLDTLHVGNLIREVQRGIELPVGFVDCGGTWMVEVVAVGVGIFTTQAALQREAIGEATSQGGIDGVHL